MTLTNEDREVLVTNYVNKSRETIGKVEFLIEHNELSLAVNRIYYGIYYILSALAVKYQFKTAKYTTR